MLGITAKALLDNGAAGLTSACRSSCRLLGYLAKGYISRGEFASIGATDLEAFGDILGVDHVITDPDQLNAYNTDWTGHYDGKSTVALKPKTTEQVSQILSHCNSNRIAVVPQGGNTGLVGGGVPVFDEVVISMSRMNSVLGFDVLSSAVTCESGCVLQDLDAFLHAHGHMMPLDLGAKGSCQIGGNVATNAGGVRFIRHGSLKGNLLGMEAVLADGTVLDMMSSLRKDNTGYDLRQLFLGSEGTLGIITKLSILAPKASNAVNLVMLSCDSFESICEAYSVARKELGEILSAVEFMDNSCLTIAVETLGLRHPFEGSGQDVRHERPFYLLIETSGSSDRHDKEKLDSFLAQVLESGVVNDGIVAQDSKQAREIWDVREMQAVGLVKYAAKHHCFKYDISVPVNEFYALVEETQDLFSDKPSVVVNGFGHLGDGNLHLNVVSKHDDPSILPRLEPFIYERTKSYKGSISAEHGLGQMKANEIFYSKSKPVVNLMGQIKRTIDPFGIMNPYKVLPES